MTDKIPSSPSGGTPSDSKLEAKLLQDFLDCIEQSIHGGGIGDDEVEQKIRATLARKAQSPDEKFLLEVAALYGLNESFMRSLPSASIEAWQSVIKNAAKRHLDDRNVMEAFRKELMELKFGGEKSAEAGGTPKGSLGEREETLQFSGLGDLIPRLRDVAQLLESGKYSPLEAAAFLLTTADRFEPRLLGQARASRSPSGMELDEFVQDWWFKDGYGHTNRGSFDIMLQPAGGTCDIRHVLRDCLRDYLATEGASRSLPEPPYPKPCGICDGVIQSKDDLDWHGYGNCREIPDVVMADLNVAELLRDLQGHIAGELGERLDKAVVALNAKCDVCSAPVKLPNELCNECKGATEGASRSLPDELQQLRDWKESAMKQLAKSDALKELLPITYLGWDVYEATADYIKKLASEGEARSPIQPELLQRVEKVLDILPCDECDHSLGLHFDRNGCEYERGDHEGGEGDHGPYGAYAMGPCGCKAESLSDDGTTAFLLLRDIRQMRLLGKLGEARSPGSLDIYLAATQAAHFKNQTVGEKNDYYITLEQLEYILRADRSDGTILRGEARSVPAPKPQWIKTLADVLGGCANILDVVKGEWGEAWSQWDQEVRDGITRELLGRLECRNPNHALTDGSPSPHEIGSSCMASPQEATCEHRMRYTGADGEWCRTCGAVIWGTPDKERMTKLTASLAPEFPNATPGPPDGVVWDASEPSLKSFGKLWTIEIGDNKRATWICQVLADENGEENARLIVAAVNAYRGSQKEEEHKS